MVQKVAYGIVGTLFAVLASIDAYGVVSADPNPGAGTSASGTTQCTLSWNQSIVSRTAGNGARLVLVAAGGRTGNASGFTKSQSRPYSATFNGISMTPVPIPASTPGTYSSGNAFCQQGTEGIALSGADGSGGWDSTAIRLFYILDSSLPEAAGSYPVSVTFGPMDGSTTWRNGAFSRAYINANQSVPNENVNGNKNNNNATITLSAGAADVTFLAMALRDYNTSVSDKAGQSLLCAYKQDSSSGQGGFFASEKFGASSDVGYTMGGSRRWVGQATAISAQTYYPLTLTAANGSISANINPYTPGYLPGTTVTLTANASPGYRFTGWSGDGATNGSNQRVVTMDSAKAVTANFVKTWTLTVINGTGGGVFDAGSTPTITANTPPTGYYFENWTGATGIQNPQNSTTSVSMDGDKTITANFSPQTYTVTFDAQGGDTPLPASKSVTYGAAYGDLAVTSRAGYTFGGWWTEPGGSGAQILNTTQVTITANQTLYAKWTLNTYNISGAVFWAGSGLSGVSITGLPGTPATSGGGAYSATVDYGFSGTATPVLAGYTFSPPSIAFSAVGADQSGQNFTAKANQTISFEPLPAKTFGDAPFGLEAGASSGLPVSYVSSDTGVATVSGVTVTLVGAGETTITASQPGNANYNAAAPVPQSLTVNKASATVSLSNLAHTYDGTAKSAAATTTPPGLTVTITYNGSATAPTNAGSYAVAATINDANYQGNASGTLSIAKAAATVSLSNLAHTYDGTAKSATATTTPPGLTVDITYDGAAAAPTNAGDYDVVATVNDVNYQGSAGDAMRINKATATVALSGLNQTYDGAPKPIGAATTPAGLAVDITYNGQPTAPTNAGSYPVAAAVNEANYQGTASDTLVIAKAASVISEAPTASDITYGQTLADSGLSGGAGTPSGAFAFTTPATMPHAGTAAQPVTFTPVDTLNYTAAAGTASVTVHPKAFTVSVVNNPTKLYNGTIDATLTENHFQVSGLVPGESVSITETAGVYDSAEIGAHTVTVALEADDFTAGVGTDLANYTLPTQATGPGTITDKFIPVITIPPTAGAITYGQTLAASSLTGGEARYGGAVVAGTFTFTDDSIAPDAGTYNASVTFTPADTVTYASASANAAVTVNKAAATVTLDNLSHTYDGAAHPATVTTSPEGLGVDITYGGAAAAPMNAGTYAVVATIDDANYQGTAADTLVIAPAALTVTADAKSKMAGEADPALTYQITAGALVPGDALSGALTREPGEAVGTYAILQGTLTAGPNYDLTYVGADLTITSNEVFTVVYTGPNPVVAPLDGRVEISVTAVNYTGEVDYQWYRVRPDKALQLIEGATGPMLVIEPVTLDDAGFYICEATCEGGFDLSPEIEVRVEETSSLPAAGLLGLAALLVAIGLASAVLIRRAPAKA